MVLLAYQYPTLDHYWRLMWGKDTIPVYVPMRDYTVFLGKTYLPSQPSQGPNASQPPSSYPLSMLAYLQEESDLTSLRHLTLYLERLAKQGRLRFLCDGLNELDSQYLEFVCAELVQTMQAKQNRLVMTCRELDYREQPELQKLVGKDAAEEALILPLRLEQITTFIEKYTKLDEQIRQKHRYSGSEINQHIEHSRLSYNCTNPMMLVTLIKIIDEVGIDPDIQIGTRGRLLRKFVAQLVRRELQQPKWSTLKEAEILSFGNSPRLLVSRLVAYSCRVGNIRCSKRDDTGDLGRIE